MVDASALTRAMDAASDWLVGAQHPEGYWMGMLETNACMEAQWLLLQHCLGVEGDRKVDGVVRGILNRQRPDGAWEVYYDAPAGDINTTVECYAALRAVGLAAGSPALAAARRWILAHGGLSQVRVFTRYWLAMIGEWPWSKTPVLPPELIYLPTWAPFNIYRFSSWARATIVPLSILCCRRPVRPLPPERRLDELFPAGRDAMDYRIVTGTRTLSWERLFLLVDRVLGQYTRLPMHLGRERAIRQCEAWIIEHQDADGAWGGIQPPWVYSLLALAALGRPVTDPTIAKGLAAFDDFWCVQQDEGTFLQASNSPVWDTLLAMQAMLDCHTGSATSEPMERAATWVLDHEVRTVGDWRKTVRHVEPGGWAFEMANDWYPDVDDTAVAITVLSQLRDRGMAADRIDGAIDRALAWMKAMQSRSGGWAAFDRDNTSRLVTRIPFCDFGEVLDPPSVDVTAHAIEAMAGLGMRRTEPTVTRALAYVFDQQEPDGSWFGRWGVNHVYGTGAVLPALAAIGHDMADPRVQRAASWLLAHQNPDGGWGETPASYVDPSLRGCGDSTPSQTAWAIMALLTTSARTHDQPISRGLSFLLDRQRSDGTWDEPQYTGTGFPGYGIGEHSHNSTTPISQGHELSRAFMINYHLYRHYFPMIALGRTHHRLSNPSG